MSVSPPGSIQEVPRALRDLRIAAGSPSFTAITARVRSERARRGDGGRALVARSTVYDCFNDGRQRLDLGLVIDIGRALIGDDDTARQWADLCWSLQHADDNARLVTASTQLPELTTAFVGRVAELEQLTSSARGVFTVSAMAGCGKTSLVTEAARRLIESGAADCSVIADLRGFHPDRPAADPAAVLDAIIRAVGGQPFQLPAGLAERRDAAYRMLAEQRVVLILDDADSAGQLAPLIADRPQSIVFVTSRVSLATLQSATHLGLEGLTASESVELLRSGVDPASEGADGLHRDLDGLAAMVGHHPLTLAVLAARFAALPDWTVADHRASLDRDGALHLDAATQAALEGSYEALREDGRRALRLLAVQPCRDLSINSLAALTDVDLATAEAVTDELLTANVATTPAPGRLGLHALVRAFGRERTFDEDRPGDRAAAITRLVDQLVATARSASQALGLGSIERTEAATRHVPAFDATSGARWLGAETDNLLAADQIWESVRPTVAMDLSEAMFSFLHQSGRPDEAVVLHRRALHAAQRLGDVVGEGVAESFIGQMLFVLGEMEDATSRLERADRLLEPTDAAQARYRVKNALGANASLGGDPATALRLFQTCREIAAEAGLTRESRSARINIAATLRELGRLEDAVAELEDLVTDLQGAGDVMGAGGSLLNLAIAEENRGNFEAARARGSEAAAIAEELGLTAMLAHARHTIGLALTGLGNPDDAVVEHEAAARLARSLGNRHVEAMAMTGLGTALVGTGRRDAARAVFDEILAMTLGVDPLTAEVLVSLARLDLALGDVSTARARLTDVVSIVGPPDPNAVAARNLLDELDRAG